MELGIDSELNFGCCIAEVVECRSGELVSPLSQTDSSNLSLLLPLTRDRNLYSLLKFLFRLESSSVMDLLRLDFSWGGAYFFPWVSSGRI